MSKPGLERFVGLPLSSLLDPAVKRRRCQQARISPPGLTCGLHGAFVHRYPIGVIDAGSLDRTSMRDVPVGFFFVTLLCVGGHSLWGRRSLHTHEFFPSLDLLVKAARLLSGSGVVRGYKKYPPGQEQDLCEVKTRDTTTSGEEFHFLNGRAAALTTNAAASNMVRRRFSRA